MSFKVTNWVWTRSESRNGARLVMLALADRADDNGCCWPSIDDLAERTKLSPRAVQKAIATLAEIGELDIENGGGRHRSNRYRIIPKPRTSDGVTGPEPRTNDGVSAQETPNSATETPNFEAETPNSATRNPVQSSPEPSIEPTENRQRNLPARRTEPTPAEALLAKWWEQYGHTTAQGKRTIQRAITDALSNGIDVAELWQALDRLGALSKPVTGGTLQFALAELRQPAPGNVVALPGQPPLRRSTTDERVAQGLALVEHFRRLEQGDTA
ncbi:helix-turn-helix domain-containing protein [Streptomyces sp. SCL15-4]|uniref:helix-turn-helix domain-containing protein n=1 Tax=Streptomyces sp. SCL15-4 TaxID=2967221 RepID=UPI00296660F9|nr:helix-turn-helix domain-containing protein [Streptomyces sp. SCL15-4]